jgi:hypothetical protein
MKEAQARFEDYVGKKMSEGGRIWPGWPSTCESSGFMVWVGSDASATWFWAT